MCIGTDQKSLLCLLICDGIVIGNLESYTIQDLKEKGQLVVHITGSWTIEILEKGQDMDHIAVFSIERIGLNFVLSIMKTRSRKNK